MPSYSLSRFRKRLIGFVLLLSAPGLLQGAEASWSLASPDGKCQISVALDREGKLSYDTRYAGKPVVLSSPLGIRRQDQVFVESLELESAGTVEARREVYDLFAGVTPHVEKLLNHRRLTFRNAKHARIGLDLAASDEGVAFRYLFPEQDPATRVVSEELTGFRLPTSSRGWLQPYHEAGPYTPAYEDFFFHVSPGDPPPRSRAKPLGWCFPALFQIAEESAWVLITESGTDDSYCGCHLGPDSSDGTYRIAFAASNETTKGQQYSVGPEPRSRLPWSLPWRVLVMGGSATNIATATLVTDVAPPCRIADASWIRPGRASWAWWSYPEGPATTEHFNAFTDFAARMNWEYTLFDAGWWKPGLKPIAEYAKSKGVAPLAWMAASDFYLPEKRRQRLDEMQAAGVAGVKVDFWCSNRQEAMGAIQALFQDAASRHLVVNLHGCTLPRGWQRTWPNFLTAEAVLGTESYFYEPHYSEKAAELNTVLPFTRNAVGPMDITPVACSPKKYKRTTTAAHELAAAMIYTSGLIHYADSPAFFDTLPAAALQLFRDAPARWEETRCLLGEPGHLAVFARRSRNTWFIAGINGTASPTSISLDLSRFRDFPHSTLFSEGPEAVSKVVAVSIPFAASWKHEMPPRGGFILRLDRESAPK